MEFALTVPILVSIVFGSIEVANGIFVKQSLTAAAHETARVATIPGATSATAIASGQAILTARSVQSGTITLSPTVTATTTGGTTITAVATAPASANSLGITMYLQNVTISATVIMNHL